MHVEPADRAMPMRRVIECDTVHRMDRIRGDEQRVAAQRHRPRVRFHAVHGQVVPALPERALHDADDLVVRFEHGPLFDMHLEICADSVRLAMLAGIADRR
ncbi:hypothetical protein OKW40_006585 [Paraburkholderia sp. RAU6.4a]